MVKQNRVSVKVYTIKDSLLSSIKGSAENAKVENAEWEVPVNTALYSIGRK
jgi:hypothetical protein